MFPRSLVPAASWALLILALTLTPIPAASTPGWLDRIHADKIVHALLFAVWTVLLVKGLRGWVSRPFIVRHAQLLGLLVALAYAVLTEVMQESMGLGRRGTLGDVLADALGIILAMAWIIWATVRRAQHRNGPGRYF